MSKVENKILLVVIIVMTLLEINGCSRASQTGINTTTTNLDKNDALKEQLIEVLKQQESAAKAGDIDKFEQLYDADQLAKFKIIYSMSGKSFDKDVLVVLTNWQDTLNKSEVIGISTINDWARLELVGASAMKSDTRKGLRTIIFHKKDNVWQYYSSPVVMLDKELSDTPETFIKKQGYSDSYIPPVTAVSEIYWTKVSFDEVARAFNNKETLNGQYIETEGSLLITPRNFIWKLTKQGSNSPTINLIPEQIISDNKGNKLILKDIMDSQKIINQCQEGCNVLVRGFIKPGTYIEERGRVENGAVKVLEIEVK